MKLFTWTNIRLVLMIMLVLFLFSFASMRNENRKITKIDVKIIDEDTPFLLPTMVNKLLIEKNEHSKTITKEGLDLKKLEKSVNNHDLIQKSELFVSVDGVLKAVVKQKTPVGRVVQETGSFYIDYEGNRMSLSENYSARVPLVSGKIDAVENEKLSEVLKMIYEDDFLKKNIIGVQVVSSGNLIMQNRNYDYTIDFGKIINIDRKFKNYKAFFQKAVLDSTLNNYKKINLKFTQQVVCIK
ncbi:MULTISPECIES: cell division protein FtsQ [Flavobacterium]|jgi:cell division protein FtsQ|uniref:Cell division protein FtsQ n=1 Tax=Flavobacterium macrobrachii TaxID=591204 RepID=A0ABS2CXD5_9FLAO|nr:MULTISPECIES: cell division protein FtsQ [Flavobacterium]MBM6499622.1 cell division protein FtsQ [Flavobacterium macrobrachii]MCZ8090722.1 cell division protein FtsQ [Flavobacterium sp.]PZO30725.1 MAG: cell division protein FtsQ [Flavobacteriaceae bacterium]